MALGKRPFRLVASGYDRFEVDQKIHFLEESLKESQSQLALSQDRVAALKKQLSDSQARLKAFKKDLALKERVADDLGHLALDQANEVVDRAKDLADLLVSKALTTASQLVSLTGGLKEGGLDWDQEVLDKLKDFHLLLDTVKPCRLKDKVDPMISKE